MNANKAYLISADTVFAYKAYLYLSVRRPFLSHGRGRLFCQLSVSLGGYGFNSDEHIPTVKYDSDFCFLPDYSDYWISYPVVWIITWIQGL